MLKRMQTKWSHTEHIRSHWPFVGSCLWWLVQTAFYVWIAPWVLLGSFLTLFHPSAQSIREFVIDLATTERSAWSQLPDMWMTISLVVGWFVVVSRIPSSPIWRLIEERLLEPLAKRISQVWKRCPALARKSLQYSAAASIVGIVCVAMLFHGRHSELSQGPSLPSYPALPGTAASSAALALADGSVVSGTAQVSRQTDSSYLVRFAEPEKGSHE